MRASRNRLSRYLTDFLPQFGPPTPSVSSFYREEFIKCQRCLEQQREYYSERAVDEVERALSEVMAQLDHLCTKTDADEVVSRLLRQFDIATGLSTSSDPRHVH